MSRIVLACSGSFGDVHPYLAVGLGLKARGHDVVIATSQFYGEKVTGEGLGFHRLGPNSAPMASSPEAVRRAFDPHTGSAFYVKELVLPYIEETHQDLVSVCKDADILLIHPTLFTAPLVAERYNLKWLSVLLAPGTFISAYDPPLMPPVPWLHALRFLGPTPQRLMFRTMKVFAKSWGVGVDRIRQPLVFIGERSLDCECSLRPASWLAARKALGVNCIIGLGLFQGMEFVLSRSLSELAEKLSVVWSRTRACHRLLRRSNVYHLKLGRDSDRNALAVVAALREAGR